MPTREPTDKPISLEECMAILDEHRDMLAKHYRHLKGNLYLKAHLTAAIYGVPLRCKAKPCRRTGLCALKDAPCMTQCTTVFRALRRETTVQDRQLMAYIVIKAMELIEGQPIDLENPQYGDLGALMPI